VETGEEQRVVPVVEGDRQSRLGPSFELVESKFHPPSARLGVVPRSTPSAAGPRGVDAPTAELRLVPQLVTHLNFLEIGQRLYISKHTAKSQAASIYRKLGASSRSEAVQRLQEIGLLEE
jgi:DNA-binding CsgD family transcriptional regulator